tara:strand:+ start:911 stop:1090 length:180 start_codon:yes stop_codon:yes gene_type:complete
MRLAVLITNYICAVILGFSFIGLGSATTEDPWLTIIALITFGPAVILSLVFAHGLRDKK